MRCAWKSLASLTTIQQTSLFAILGMLACFGRTELQAEWGIFLGYLTGLMIESFLRFPDESVLESESEEWESHSRAA
jgi:hypothetical protein